MVSSTGYSVCHTMCAKSHLDVENPSINEGDLTPDYQFSLENPARLALQLILFMMMFLE